MCLLPSSRCCTADFAVFQAAVVAVVLREKVGVRERFCPTAGCRRWRQILCCHPQRPRETPLRSGKSASAGHRLQSGAAWQSGFCFPNSSFSRSGVLSSASQAAWLPSASSTRRVQIKLSARESRCSGCNAVLPKLFGLCHFLRRGVAHGAPVRPSRRAAPQNVRSGCPRTSRLAWPRWRCSR